MRSRPDLKVYLTPAEPTPGNRLSVTAVLLSRSETPIDGVEAHLTGTATFGNAGTAQARRHPLLALVASTTKARLTPGEHRFNFAFDIPPGVPPAYRSSTLWIEYDLDLRVAIPWWPDRSARYAVPVVARPSAATGTAATFCTDARGPQGSDLYLEASLETTTIPLGGVIRGAVSVANVARHRVRRVDLALVHTEQEGAGAAPVGMERYVVRFHDGAPPEGQALPFQVALPPDAATTFVAGLVEMRWYLEARAVVTLGSDAVLAAPFEVIRPAAGVQTRSAALARIPPVGRDRRALIWAESARRNGLANDAADERMTLEVGAVSLTLTLEPRKAGGLALTASVAWPRLGIDLAVAERRWVDAWSGEVIVIDAPGFSDRFTVRGREAAQVRAFLDEASCRWLLLFDEAAVGDEGATLVSPGAAQSLEELDGFVARAVGAARAFDEVADRVPPPAAMASFLPAWRAFAAMLGGRLVVGEMTIHDATLEEAPLVIATEWSEEGAPEATVVRFPLPEREGAAAPGGLAPRALDGAMRELVASLTPQLTALDVGERAVKARVPAPVEDPAALEPILAGLGRLARRLAGGAARGPYR